MKLGENNVTKTLTKKTEILKELLLTPTEKAKIKISKLKSEIEEKLGIEETALSEIQKELKIKKNTIRQLKELKLKINKLESPEKITNEAKREIAKLFDEIEKQNN